MYLMHRQGTVRSGAALLSILCLSWNVQAQTFRSTIDNEYVGKSVSGEREENCLSETTDNRRLLVRREHASMRLVYTMELERTREARYRGRSETERARCAPGYERSLATIRFYIADENSSSTNYQGTVVSATSNAFGFRTGERITGTVEVFDGGRGLEFSNEQFVEGQAKLLAKNFRNAAGVEAAYHIPAGTPDIVLACKVVASDGATVSSTSSSSSGSYQTNLSSEVSRSQCQAHGWQNLRKTVSVWTREQRCDGYQCEITPTFFRWGDSNLSRMTGQMKDGCYTYVCERVREQAPKF